jgi:hypothetical protein
MRGLDSLATCTLTNPRHLVIPNKFEVVLVDSTDEHYLVQTKQLDVEPFQVGLYI